MRLMLSFLTTLALAVLAALAAAVVEFFYNTNLGETVAVGLAVLVVLIVLQGALARMEDGLVFKRRVEDLANLEATLGRTLQHLNARVTRLENREESRPVVDETTINAGLEQLRSSLRDVSGSLVDLELRVDRLVLRASNPETPRAAAAEPETGAGTQPPEPVHRYENGADPDMLPDEGDAIGLAALVEQAGRTGSIDLYLQPIVTLPQRRARYYDVIACLRTPQGAPIWPARYTAPASAAGLLAQIEHRTVFRTVEILRRLTPDSGDIGMFCRLSLDSLAEDEAFTDLLEFMQANKALTDRVTFEIDQASLAAATASDRERLAALTAIGFRLSVTDVSQLDDDFEQLAARGLRFYRMPVDRLLGAGLEPGANTNDLSDTLARFGIDLIANDVTDEETVVALLDRDVRFGQGRLFSAPRPLRQSTQGPRPWAEQHSAV